MSIQWKVRIDVPRLQANLSSANSWPFTPDDTDRWLAFMGFRQDDGYWLTDERRLRRLEPDEILEKSEFGVVDDLAPDEVLDEPEIGSYELETVGIGPIPG